MKKKNKQLSEIEFQMLHERAMLQAQYMKSMQDISLESVPFR